MNILFKELAEQAGIQIVKPTNYSTALAEQGQLKNIEKFAELIVRECDRYARSAWEHGPLLGRDLLIHFGVEEMSDE